MEITQQALALIHRIRTRGVLTWKPGLDLKHLAKRKQRQHLPETATIEEYNTLILHILSQDESELYLYALTGFDQRYYVMATALGSSCSERTA